MAANKIPETIHMTLSFEVGREWIEDFVAEGKEVTLQMMLDTLREHAIEFLADDAYSMVQTSDVFDENGEKVWSADIFFES